MDWLVLFPYNKKLFVWRDVFGTITMNFPIHAIILLLEHQADALSLTTQDHQYQGD
jgi:hypothetical protein